MPETTVICLSWTYHSAPVELRAAVADAIRSLCERYSHTPGHVALLTCNRAELTIDPERFPLSTDSILEEISALTGISCADIKAGGRLWAGEEAYQHLLRVAAGLESMVLGEPQILGQITDAWEQAVAQKNTGPVLHTLFNAVVRTGKRVRTETEISRHPASMSSVAIQALLHGVANPHEVRALVIGYGNMSQLALKSLRRHGVREIGIVNRRIARAQAEAQAYGYRLWDLDHLAEALTWADRVFTAAAAPEPLIGMELLQEVMDKRQGRRLVAVDIAVPQNIMAEAEQVPGFERIGIDHLKLRIDHGLSARQQCVPAVEAIIAAEMDKLAIEMHELAVRPLIRDLRQKADAIRISELERTLRYMGDVDEQTRQQLQYFSQALINKLLHEPTIRLRQKASVGEAEPYAETVRELFDLMPVS
ncbi:MAG: glutamyl-tRNA reductase [Chloroflexi bacterium]|nr:glutamyl-tRNA reductase [Chloroflexota bacterium]